MGKYNTRICIFETGKISLEKHREIPSLIEFPILENEVTYLQPESPIITLANLKLVGTWRDIYNHEGIGIYVQESLLKEEHRNFCSFLLNLVEEFLFKESKYESWVMGLTNKCSREEHHLVASMHKFSRRKMKDKGTSKLKYIRIAEI